MPFEIENKIFQTVLAENEKFAKPLSNLDKYLSIAEVEFPLSNDEALAFSKRCISSIKKKADVLSDLLPNGQELGHKKCLDLAAKMCFFASYEDFKAYADNFASMPATHRFTSGNTIKLVTSLLRAQENDLDMFLMQHIGGASAVLRLNSKLNEDVSSRIANTVFRDTGLSRSTDVVTEHQVSEIVSRIHQDPGVHYFNKILSYVPFKGKREQALGEFSQASYEEFITCQVQFPLDMGLLTKIPVSLTAMEVLVAEIMTDIHKHGELEGFSKKQIIKKLASELTKLEVERHINSVFGSDFYSIVNRATN